MQACADRELRERPPWCHAPLATDAGTAVSHGCFQHGRSAMFRKRQHLHTAGVGSDRGCYRVWKVMQCLWSREQTWSASLETLGTPAAWPELGSLPEAPFPPQTKPTHSLEGRGSREGGWAHARCVLGELCMGLWAPVLMDSHHPTLRAGQGPLAEPPAASGAERRWPGSVCVSAIHPFQDVGWGPWPAWREAEGGSWRQGLWPKEA